MDSKEKYKALFTETQWDIFEKYINGPDVVKKKSKLVNMQKTPQIVATKERFNVDRSLLNQEITTFKSMVGDIQIGKKQFESQIYNQLRILNKDKSERIRNLSQGSNSIMSFFESIGEDDLSYARELIVCLKSRSNTRMKQSEDEKLYGNINKYLSSAHDYCENLLNTRRKSIQEQ